MHESAYACHTYDRENMVAQVDCNNEITSVLKAAESKFKIDYWPYMHSPDPENENSVTFCIKKMSKNYLPNILSVGAIQKIAFSAFITYASLAAMQSL